MTQSLVNPPPDVQAAVDAVMRACHAWQPTEVSPLPPGAGDPHHTTEAQVCTAILHPAELMVNTVSILVMLEIILAIVIVTTRLYRLPGWLARLSLGAVRRCWKRVRA
jgi:hypothetical protein